MEFFRLPTDRVAELGSQVEIERAGTKAGPTLGTTCSARIIDAAVNALKSAIAVELTLSERSVSAPPPESMGP
jgi:hypothetical protein